MRGLTKERRLKRQCPSCRGTQVLWGNRIDDWAVTLPAREEKPRAIRLAPFADVCQDCGLVSLFVRIADAR